MEGFFMFKMQLPAFTAIQNLKLIFSQEKIQKLKRYATQVIASSVIVSLLATDLAYAMQDEIYGIIQKDEGRRGSYIPPKLSLGNTDTTETIPPSQKVQGLPLTSFSDAHFSNDGEAKEPTSLREGSDLSDDLSSSSEDSEGSQRKPSSDEDSGESGSSNSSPTRSPRKDKEKGEDLEAANDHKGTLLIGGEKIRLSKLKEWMISNFDPEVSIFTEGGEDTKKSYFQRKAQNLKKRRKNRVFSNTEGYVPFKDEDEETSNKGDCESSDDESVYTQDSPRGTNIPLQNMGKGNEGLTGSSFKRHE